MEFRVFIGCKPAELVLKPRLEIRAFNINTVGIYKIDRALHILRVQCKLCFSPRLLRQEAFLRVFLRLLRFLGQLSKKPCFRCPCRDFILDFLYAQLSCAFQCTPLIRVRIPVFVDKRAVSIPQRPALQRQRNQIAELSLRQMLLQWQHSIICAEAFQADHLRTLCQQCCSKLPCLLCGNGLGKEDPDMRALPGTGALDQCVDLFQFAYFAERVDFVPP